MEIIAVVIVVYKIKHITGYRGRGNYVQDCVYVLLTAFLHAFCCFGLR